MQRTMPADMRGGMSGERAVAGAGGAKTQASGDRSQGRLGPTLDANNVLWEAKTNHYCNGYSTV